MMRLPKDQVVGIRKVPFKVGSFKLQARLGKAHVLVDKRGILTTASLLHNRGNRGTRGAFLAQIFQTSPATGNPSTASFIGAFALDTLPCVDLQTV